MNIREYIRNNTLLFDGAMGTWYASSYQEPYGVCELANLEHPERIREIHSAYIRSGARAVRTNTFGAYPEYLEKADQKSVIEAAWNLAEEAAGDRDIYIFADIGPASGDDPEEIEKKYEDMIRVFLDCGAKHFMFETLSSDAGIAGSAEMIRREVPDAFIIVSFGIQPDGFSREGIHYRSLLKKMSGSGLIDAVGMNCVSGARHMAELLEKAGTYPVPLCALPNAGYPAVRGNRTYYDGGTEYFAGQIGEIAGMGVHIVGGCCGTTPGHIREVHRVLFHEDRPRILPSGYRVQVREEDPVKNGLPGADGQTAAENRFYEKLMSGEKVIAVELDSPKNSDISGYMRGAAELKNAGADALTIADCPVARARMDSSILACRVRRDLDMDVLPHMTCRDRNINAAKALLLGIHAENIRNVLIVTGDPIPSHERDEVRSVFQFNSVKMASFIRSLNEELFADPVRVFGALNLNVHNFDAELKKAARKEEAGTCAFLTQPVLTEQALENLKRAKETLRGKILGGIIPVVSERNAQFMNSEINGINVSETIIRLYRGKNRQEGEELACGISCEIAGRMRDHVDGYYLMTPFSRTGLMARIIRRIRENCM